MAMTYVPYGATTPSFDLDVETFALQTAGAYRLYSDHDKDDDDQVSSAYETKLEELEGLEPQTEVDKWETLLLSIPNTPSELNLGANYQFEKTDQKHRMGDLLKSCFQIYKKKYPNVATHNQHDTPSFYQWLDSLPEMERIAMMADSLKEFGGRAIDKIKVRNYDFSQHNLKPSLVKAFLRGVKYLDQTSRKDYRVRIAPGVAQYRGKPFSTVQMRTVFSGAGFGIWVMSPKGKMYAGSHVLGEFHHSSFLSGTSVRCGGEIRANNGKFEFLSAKSGHYMPSLEHLAWSIEILLKQGMDLTNTRVAVWSKTDRGVRLPTAREFLANKSLYNAWGEFKPAEMARIQQGDFSGFASI
jgi:hypothetical protein